MFGKRTPEFEIAFADFQIVSVGCSLHHRVHKTEWCLSSFLFEKRSAQFQEHDTRIGVSVEHWNDLKMQWFTQTDSVYLPWFSSQCGVDLIDKLGICNSLVPGLTWKWSCKSWLIRLWRLDIVSQFMQICLVIHAVRQKSPNRPWISHSAEK